jgi:hypothetical protein
MRGTSAPALKLHRLLCLAALVAIVGCGRSQDGLGAVNGLTCRLVIPSTTPDKNHAINGQFILTNVGQEPIALCGLNGGHWGEEQGGKITRIITPEFFKSDGPTRVQLAGSNVVLKPGESHPLSFEIFDTGGNDNLQLTVIYEVSEKFGIDLKVWSGTLKAKQDFKITRPAAQ